MVNINIYGIEIEFPFEPYECQKAYMEKVLQCIINGENGVLESPTGTGKTLCLLCATLAWRETFAAKLQLEHTRASRPAQRSQFSDELNIKLSKAGGSIESSESFEKVFPGAPKIIYASRTHSQISQVIGELKNTRYKPSICVLGSRDQMCINSEVMKEESSNGKVHMCRVKVANKNCFYYNNLEISKSNVSRGIQDIEDLVAEGTEKKFCPYYMSRELGKQADLTFMPYNYILDFKARTAHSIDLSNTIIILDEGHNVERVCEDNMSFDFTSFDLASCIEDCQQCIEVLIQKEEDGLVDEEFKAEITAEDASLMKAVFLQLEKVISEVTLNVNDSSTTKSASFLFDQLGKLNINMISRDQIIHTIEQMSGMLAASKMKAFKAKNYALDKFATILKTIFTNEGTPSHMQNTQKFYKVHIHSEKIQNKDKQKKLDVWTARSNSSKEAPRTLSYWCFSPGLTMRELMQQGVRSLILTSGTLSPLSSFKLELNIPFNVELENSHVINPQQVFVGIVAQGPDGRRLNSSYQYRSTPDYQVSLGNTVVNMSRIIPKGVLVFFPSYPVMDMIIAKWQECGIWDRLSSCKGLFVEPRNKGGLREIMHQYYEKVNDPKLKGAIFFAVCRGKVSEGLDFADGNGRAVIITGLPFPPSQDPKVVLKKQFLDEHKSVISLSGKDWYRQQASRAVNQAIGRVIRHKSDYGAILLCDERFLNADAKAHLPSWIKQQIHVYSDFGYMQRDLVKFFRMIQQKMGVTESICDSKRKLDAIYNEAEKEYTEVKPKSMKVSDDFGKAATSSSTIELNSIATASLTQLESSSPKRCSIFTSLQGVDRDSENKSISSDLLSSKILGSNNNTTQTLVKSKKYKIVKNAMSSNVKNATASNVTKLDTKCEEKREDAKSFLVRVKGKLCAEKYNKFSEALKLYKQSKNVNVLVLQFRDVFDTSNDEQMNILKSFSSYLRQADRKYFEEFCEGLSGEVP